MSLSERFTSSQRKTIKRAHILTAKPPPKRKNLSRLESLPVELIEKIFLYSLNANLPRASPSLAARVSSERVYRALILLAFWNDADGPESNGAGEIARILRPLDYVPIGFDERAELQRTILRCRWCTVDRLLSRFPDLMELAIQRYWFRAGIIMSDDQEGNLARFLAREEGEGGEDGGMRSFEGTDKHNNRYTLSVSPLVFITVTCHDADAVATHRIIGVTEFPERLLKGEDGFTSEVIAYLEILRLACGFNSTELMETQIAVPRDALQKGIHSALVEHNSDALALLLKIDEYYFRCKNTTATANGSVPYTILAEHFRTAVRVARNDRSLFQLLVRASAESVPADDSEITQWAMDFDDSFGRWLLDLMLQLPQRIEAANANPAEGAVFYMGRANGRVELARRYLNDVLGVEELGSWMEESSHDIESQWKAI
ncbi:hypothetical protein BBP40_006291 [Aspergillus hancockii]|nr:hypothetical protein BBP40_006291 [Aspergillus hancockii]